LGAAGCAEPVPAPPKLPAPAKAQSLTEKLTKKPWQDNGKWVDVFWWNNEYWPIWAINEWDLKLLDHDARSCSRITKVTGPLGNSVIGVNHNNNHNGRR
jgi:hypothetical protein